MGCCENSAEFLGSKNDGKFGQLRDYALLKNFFPLNQQSEYKVFSIG